MVERSIFALHIGSRLFAKPIFESTMYSKNFFMKIFSQAFSKNLIGDWGGAPQKILSIN